MLKRKKPEPGPTLDETLEMLRRSAREQRAVAPDELAQSDVTESTTPKVTDPHPAA